MVDELIARRPAQRQALARRRVDNRAAAKESELGELLRAAWAQPEREFQYAACDLVQRWGTNVSPGFLVVAKADRPAPIRPGGPWQ